VKRITMALALVLGIAASGLAQNLPRFELSFHYGGMTRNLDSAGSYNYDWTGTLYSLDQLGSFSRFHITSEGGAGLGGGLSLFLTPSLGIGFNAAYYRTSVLMMSESDMWWSWIDSGTYFAYDAVLDEPLWMGADGDLRTIPLSLNFIVRFGAKHLLGYFSGGPTLYINRFFVDSEIVYALVSTTWNGFYYQQAVDVIRVPMKIDQRWTSFGFNIGGGLTVWVVPAFGLFCDIRFYSCGQRQFDWEFVTGEYDGLFGNLIYDFDQQDIDAIYEDGRIKPPVSIDPSFLQIGVGVKIKLW